MEVTRAGGTLGIPGLYVTGDPGASTRTPRSASLGIRIGLGWAKSHSFTTGQCPVMKYNRELMQAHPARQDQDRQGRQRQTITLDEAPKGYKDFDKGRRQEVRARPARHDQGRLTSSTTRSAD